MFRLWLTVVLCSSALLAGTITVPNAQTDASGNLQNGGPPVPVPGITQMLFDSSQFTGPILITALSFRPKAGTGPVDIDYGDVSVYLSTSPKSPAATSPNPMSLTFDDNKGPDFTLVFSGIGVRLTDPGCSGPAVCAFTLTNVLSTPFLYDPSKGSLLLQVVSSGFRDVLGTSAVDAMSFDPSSALIAEVAAFGTTDAPTGFFYEPRGLITQFAFADVPEPASALMAMLGLSAVLWGARKRRFTNRF